MNWDQLSRQQVGRYGEYYVQMAFTRCGLSVFRAEVDDRGIDLVVRTEKGDHYDVQVKTVRGLSYVFLRKKHFPLLPDRLLALAMIDTAPVPRLWLIPAEVWQRPDGFFVSREYEGKRSAPEWGINLSARNLARLEEFDFDEMVAKL